MAQKKTLVVYYSRTGITRRVAESLAALLGADVEEICEPRSRIGFLALLRSAGEALLKRKAAITPPQKDPGLYDLVVVGTPVWAWSVASPVRNYLAAQRARLPQVAFFCTLGNTGADPVFAQLRNLTGKCPRSLAAFKDRDVAEKRHAARLEAFARSLR